MPLSGNKNQILEFTSKEISEEGGNKKFTTHTIK